MPHLHEYHTCMSAARRQPHLRWDDHIVAFHGHGVLPSDTWQAVREKTLGGDYWRHVRAPLLELQDSLCQRWDNLWHRRHDPWSPASHLPHTCHLCGGYDTRSSTLPAGINRCTQCCQVAGCPWPEPPAGTRQRMEEEALQRRIEGARTPSHGHSGSSGAALLWIHVHLRDPTSVVNLSHVFVP